jgi:molybdenum cofactor cytidylyltransferase
MDIYDKLFNRRGDDVLKIAMIVLAAGFSSRMGVMKPLLPVGGVSALLRAVSLGRPEHIHSISVVTGHRCEDVEAELSSYHSKNLRRVYNAKYADGMFTSVKAGIHSLPGDVDGFFLLPVDHCGVTPETLDKIISAFVLSDGQAVVYPTYNGEQGHPPLIPFSFMSGIKDYDGFDGMRGYLSGFPFEEVDVSDRGVLLDMDTPQDYTVLLRHLGLPTYPDDAVCQQLLEKYEMPDNIVFHSLQVHELALRMADLLGEKGIPINKDLLSSACLLHDILRSEAKHEEAGSQLLLTMGYPEAAVLIASHMDLPEAYHPAPDETALLYLADKLARYGKIVPIEETRAGLQTRFADDPAALAHAETRMRHAQMILDMLHAQYKIEYADIAPLQPDHNQYK